MEYFDWKLTIRINILMLKSVGLWPKGNEIYKPNLYMLYAIISVVIIMGGHNFFQLMNIFFVYNDLEALAESMFITATDSLISVKLCFFILNIRTLKELMMSLNSVIFQPKSVQQVELVWPRLNIWKKTYVIYWILVGTTVCVWAIFPFLSNSVKDYRLPFSAWYPYDTKISPFYEITYFYQVLGMSFRTVAALNMDTMIAALMMYTATQCDILCDDLKNLQKDFSEIFKGRVKHHQEIVRFAKNTNKFFNMILLGQFFTSITVIAFTMFQLTLVAPLSGASLSHMSYISAIIVQIFLYCWFGNEIEIQ
ncbi:7tm 6 domain containing protein, partial [Asbolus verrucosus]